MLPSSHLNTFTIYLNDDKITDALHTILLHSDIIENLEASALATFWDKCTKSSIPNNIINLTHLIGLLRSTYKNNKYLPSPSQIKRIDYNKACDPSIPAANRHKIRNALLLCFDDDFGPIIYQDLLQHINLLVLLVDYLIKDEINLSDINISRFNSGQQLIIEEYKKLEVPVKPALEMLLDLITFDEKFLFDQLWPADQKLNLRLYFQQTLHIILGGRTGMGKTTLARELFKPYVEENKLPKKSEGQRGQEDPFLVQTTLNRPYKDEEKAYRQFLFPQDNEEELTFTIKMTDIGGYGANVTDKNLTQHEADLINAVSYVINQSFIENDPIHMMLYLIDDRIPIEDLLIIKSVSYLIPVILIKSKSPLPPTKDFIEYVDKCDLGKNCYYLYAVESEGYHGNNADNVPIFTPSSGFIKLTKVMSEAYYTSHFRNYFSEYYIGKNSPLYQKYFRRRAKRAWSAIASSAATAGVACGILPPILDAAAFVFIATSMIGVINNIYGVNVNIDLMSIVIKFGFKAGLAAAVTTIGTFGAMGLGMFLKISLWGYIAAVGISGASAVASMTLIGYSLVETYKNFCEKNKNMQELTKKYILDELILIKETSSEYKEYVKKMKNMEAERRQGEKMAEEFDSNKVKVHVQKF